MAKTGSPADRLHLPFRLAGALSQLMRRPPAQAVWQKHFRRLIGPFGYRAFVTVATVMEARPCPPSAGLG